MLIPAFDLTVKKGKADEAFALPLRINNRKYNHSTPLTFITVSTPLEKCFRTFCQQ
jgi:hypothetical protein